MRKVLHVLKCIVLLAYLGFMVLCAHSCFMSGQQTEGEPEAAADSVISNTITALANSVQLSSGSYPMETEVLTAVVSPSDLHLLDSFANLRSADFSGSTCYSEILAWAHSHPAVSVRYTVQLPDGQTVGNDTQLLDLSDISSADAWQVPELLKALPDIVSIEFGTADPNNLISSADLAAIQAACPDAVINYSLNLLGQQVKLSDAEVDLSTMGSEQLQEAASVLRCMSSLRLMHVNSALSLSDVAVLHDASPASAIDYPFNVWGVDGNLADEYLSFSHITMNDEGAAVRQILPMMKNLQTLDMDSCGVSDGSMAVIRDENPNVDVIWRIWFAGYSVRTDVERILASSTMRGGEVSDEEAAKLQYCTKVRYLDVGHNKVLTDISFARSMPDLEVLILAINNVSDISPLADCPKLEYLEINSTNVTDLSPLSNSMALRHLNIGRTAKDENNTGDDLDRPRVSDISPLYGLHDLERLWIGSVTAPSIPTEQITHMQECAPNCVINLDAGDPSQGEWRTTGERPNWVWEEWLRTGVFNDPLNERYLLLREQFQYDLGVSAYSLPENDPLY